MNRYAAIVLLTLAAGCAVARAQVTIDPYAWQFPQTSNVSSSADDLIEELQGHVQKVLDAGRLAPLYVSFADQESSGYTVYQEPGRIITTLAWAYPYLTSTQQTAVRSYVAAELADSTHAPWATYPLPHSAGTAREEHPKTKWWYESSTFGSKRPSVQVIYGLWLYGHRTGDWSLIQGYWSTIKTMYNNRVAQADLYGTMCAHIAMARLADRFSDSTMRTTALSNLQTQLNAGLSFSTIESRAWDKVPYWDSPYRDMYDSRNESTTYRGWVFLNLSPEMGRYLNDYLRQTVLDRHAIGYQRFPYWWLTKTSYFIRSWCGDEGTGIITEVNGMMGPVERWVVGASAATMRKFTNGAPHGIGDCYWLENLVLAIEAYGTTAWTDVRGTTQDTTAPAAVTNLATSNPTASSVQLSWTAPGDDGSTGTATTYDIRYRTGGAVTDSNWSSATQVSGEPTPAGAGTNQSMTVSGLTAGTTYYFAIKTADEVPNWSALSNSPSGTTSASSDTTAPAAVTNLATSNPTSGSIQLSWTAPGDDGSTGTATSYDVRYSTSAINDTNWSSATQVTGEPTPQAAGTNQSMTVSGLSASTTYYFAIKTADEVPNWSGISNSPSGTTTSGGGGVTLTNPGFEAGSLTGWTVNGGTFSINTTSPQAGTYDVYYAATIGDQRLYQAGVQLTGGTTYTLTAYYRVDQASVSAEGWRFAEIGFYPSGGPNWGNYLARAIINDNATTSGWVQVSVEYTPASNETVSIGFASWQTDAIYGLDSFAVSGGSTPPPDTIPPASVGNLAAGSATSTSIQLTWTAPGDDGTTGTASTYDIRYRTGGAVTDSNWSSATQATGEPTPAGAGTGQSFTVTGLSASTTYYFAIKTADEVPNWSAISNSPSGTTTAAADTTAPAAVTNLATSNPTANSLQLSWTAPGDDGSTGTAASYDIRYRTGGAVTDTNWSSATQVTGEPTPASAGTNQSMTVSGLSASTTYYFAIKTSDEVPNVSALSNSPSGATSSGSTNLLTNGGFEAGSLSSWTVNGGTFTANTTSPQAGTYDVYHAGALSDQRLYQGSLSLSGGVTYTLTAYYRIDQASVNAEGWRFAEIGFYPSGGPNWGNYLARTQINDNATTSGWVQVTLEYTPSSTGTYSIGFCNWQTDAIYGLDSFELVEGSLGMGASMAMETLEEPQEATRVAPEAAAPRQARRAMAESLRRAQREPEPVAAAAPDPTVPPEAPAPPAPPAVEPAADVAAAETEPTVAAPAEPAGLVTAVDTPLTGQADGPASAMFSVVAYPQHGSLLLDAAGGFTYTPDPGYEGEDAFTYKALDGQGAAEPQTVTITVGNAE